MNDIPLRQNQDANLRLLRARQEMFHRAKLVFIAQLLLTVLLPVSGAIWGLVHEDQRATIALLSLVMTVVDAALLDRAQRRFVRNGAKAAEAFDCSVLQLPWNTLAAGKPLDDEAVEEAATSWERRRQNKGLIDWYPNEVGQASLSLGRLICQRTNLWYDGRLRRLNGSLALLLAWALPITLLLACWWLNLRLSALRLLRAQNDEDVDVLERLGLGVPAVGSCQEIMIDVERRLDRGPNVFLPPTGVVLFRLRQLQAGFEGGESVADLAHDGLQ